MASAALQVRHITPEGYLQRERASEERHEYFNGEIYAMAGGSRQHAMLARNILTLLWAQLKGKPCEPFGSDLRIHVPASDLYTYPDVSVLCGRGQFVDAQGDNLENPTVLVEVLSPSTEAYDRGDKFAHYKLLPSLRDYLLVSQNEPRVEHYTRRGDEWALTVADGHDAVVRIESIGCVLQLSEVYERVDLPVHFPHPGHP